ncbi:MAG: S41 family peptidase [Luteimonas sp.]
MKVLFVLLMLCWPLAGACQAHPSLDAVIAFARERAYRADSVAWPDVIAQANDIAASSGEDAAIRYVVRALGDHHSFYLTPDAGAMAHAATPAALHTATPISDARPAVDGVPVVEVHGWSGSVEEGNAAATALRSQLVHALATQRCGIVLDFANNHGGNMWPMLAGLAPLVTEGLLGYFQDARGHRQAIARRGEALFLGGKPLPYRAGGAQPAHAAGRVAIVLGPGSASSGEIVPIMFHGQGNVRLFGRPTSGHSTANTMHQLANGGFVGITTGTTLDRDGVEFGGTIVPDVAGDDGVADAAQWVRSGCADGSP